MEDFSPHRPFPFIVKVRKSLPSSSQRVNSSSGPHSHPTPQKHKFKNVFPLTDLLTTNSIWKLSSTEHGNWNERLSFPKDEDGPSLIPGKIIESALRKKEYTDDHLEIGITATDQSDRLIKTATNPDEHTTDAM